MFLKAATILLIWTSLISHKPTKIIESRQVSLTTIVTNECQDNVFSFADYNGKTGSLIFKSLYDISKIKIYDQSGQLNFELHVMSDSFMISKNIFEKGKHTLGFIISDTNEVFLTEVEIR